MGFNPSANLRTKVYWRQNYGVYASSDIPRNVLEFHFDQMNVGSKLRFVSILNLDCSASTKETTNGGWSAVPERLFYFPFGKY